jgi:hypothetical protein
VASESRRGVIVELAVGIPGSDLPAFSAEVLADSQNTCSNQARNTRSTRGCVRRPRTCGGRAAWNGGSYGSNQPTPFPLQPQSDRWLMQTVVEHSSSDQAREAAAAWLGET